MTPVRRQDWRGRLSAVVEGALQRPFEWGVHDCALFAADAVLAMTDVDLAEGWRDRYSTRIGAARLLRKADLAGHVDIAAISLRELPPAAASIGDIAALELEEGPALGVVVGPMIAAPGPDRLQFLTRDRATRTFHVPFAGEDA